MANKLPDPEALVRELVPRLGLFVMPTRRDCVGVGNDDDLVCADNCITKALLNAGGRIDDHEIELLA